MTHYKFTLDNMRAISTNRANMFSKYGVSKADSYRMFEAELEIKMAKKYSKQVKEIRDTFDPEKHCINFDFRFYYSCETKSGRLHKRKGDVTNMIKTTEDALFNYLEIDDAFVTTAQASKIHSEKEKIVIDLWIKEYERL